MSSGHSPNPLKRRSRSPPPWRREPQRPRHDDSLSSSSSRRHRESQRSQVALNALQEAEQARAWVAQEDRFILQQSKKKAEIRMKDGRAKPIDYLAVNLRVIDEDREINPLDDDIPEEELDIVDPEGMLDGLDKKDLEELKADIETYIGLETNRNNSEFWKTMKILTLDRLSKVNASASSRTVSSVASDIDNLLSTKTLTELTALETQITTKLSSNEPIDVDYWTELLHSLRTWKAKASLKAVYSKVIASRVAILHKQQAEEAATVRKKLEAILRGEKPDAPTPENVTYRSPLPVGYERIMDPEPLLKLRYDDKPLASQSESDWLADTTRERKKIQKLGYVPHKPIPITNKALSGGNASTSGMMDGGDKGVTSSLPTTDAVVTTTPRFAALTTTDNDFTAASLALYNREITRGISDNEEILTSEADLQLPPPVWSNKYRPRKPRYFNRVQMGYEWNKYNQTHYDHDNPPPKVVQGYKFNIFYPDLIDKTKAPTYRIEREGGRKKGESVAPAGEEDTCLIRFIAGPPYEDIAFRIVDKEWDYSAKRERGFKSCFEKGILQVHFMLKKIYYRK